MHLFLDRPIQYLPTREPMRELYQLAPMGVTKEECTTGAGGRDLSDRVRRNANWDPFTTPIARRADEDAGDRRTTVFTITSVIALTGNIPGR